MYEGIRKVVYRLFPDVCYDSNGKARRYNAALGYETSRRLIHLVATHKDENDYNDTIKQLKLHYDDYSNMEVDEINLLYYLAIGLESETHTAVCECCQRAFSYDTKEFRLACYRNWDVGIPTKCPECTKEV